MGMHDYLFEQNREKRARAKSAARCPLIPTLQSLARVHSSLSQLLNLPKKQLYKLPAKQAGNRPTDRVVSDYAVMYLYEGGSV